MTDTDIDISDVLGDGGSAPPSDDSDDNGGNETAEFDISVLLSSSGTYSHDENSDLEPFWWKDNEGEVDPTFSALIEPSNLWGPHQDHVDPSIEEHMMRMIRDLMLLFGSAFIPPTLWGPIGSRKTRTVQALCKLLDENGRPFQVITMQPSTQDPTIIHGMMYTSPDEDGKVIMNQSVPRIAEMVYDYWRYHHGLTIIFMDEMTTCSVTQQQAMLGILTHGEFGPVNIHDYSTMILAANPRNTVSGVHELGEQFMNRGSHLPWYEVADIFIEDWSSGFNGATTPPDPHTEWFITELVKEGGDETFRSNGTTTSWNPQNLVPYERFENTPRSITNFADMLTVIDDVFEDSPQQVKNAYVIETGRALLGKNWVSKVETVIGKEKSSLIPANLIRQYREEKGKIEDSDEYANEFIERTCNLPDGSKPTDDAAQGIAVRLLEKVVSANGSINEDAYAMTWAFLSSFADKPFVLSEAIKKTANTGISLANSGKLDKAKIIPSFVPDEIKDHLRQIKE